MQRIHFIVFSVFYGIALGLIVVPPVLISVLADDPQKPSRLRRMTLHWTVIPTNAESFWRQPVVLAGVTDAVLIDGGFTLSVGHRLVDAIRLSGKRLRQVIVTCHDPDYYFSLGVVKAAFPDVPIVAPAPIVAKITETVQHKIDVWRPQLGDDGPASFADLALPSALDGSELELEGARIQIISARQPLNYHLWLPVERAILGGVQISGANHVWMADTRTPAERAPWIADLNAMIALGPDAAPPGHAPPGSTAGLAAITATRDYLLAFDEEQARAANADALIASMRARYPNLGMDFILDLGARVCMGDVGWP